MLIVTFRNLSNLAEISDYEYQIRITTTADTLHTIETGYVRGHRRSDGWEALVKRLLKKREVTK